MKGLSKILKKPSRAFASASGPQEFEDEVERMAWTMRRHAKKIYEKTKKYERETVRTKRVIAILGHGRMLHGHRAHLKAAMEADDTDATMVAYELCQGELSILANRYGITA